MKCPLCESEAIIIKKQILEYSVITFLQCSDRNCSHKFITNIPTKPYPDKENGTAKSSPKNEVKKSHSFHFLDNRD